RVRCEASSVGLAADGTMFFSPTVLRQNELLKAKPADTGPTEPLAQYAHSRIPLWPQHFVLSRDDRWLAVALKDGPTTNIWTISTADGSFHQITDFGHRPTLIARQVSWSPDGRFIYAAVVDLDADIILLDGIVP